MRRWGWLLLATAAAAPTACQPGPRPMTDAEKQAVARDVRAQVDSFVAALHRLDGQPFVDQLASIEFYGENGTIPYPTRDSLLSATAHFPGAYTSLDITWEGEPIITVLGPDAAAFSVPFREAAQPRTGAALKVHGLWTGVYQRVNGKWGIVQAHESYVPDEPATAR